jgi:hypothetical protein
MDIDDRGPDDQDDQEPVPRGGPAIGMKHVGHDNGDP